ncbi:hypothetical protein [Actinoalloteichus spitiensis]|uniref:hypothetical protein n=1 Tax=Actinoalloteichus spitiensis TaxID=252394 RepID=UPI0002DDC8AB|nr:hypothetical protein [Actinoalloteichus spitiensis]
MGDSFELAVLRSITAWPVEPVLLLAVRHVRRVPDATPLKIMVEGREAVSGACAAFVSLSLCSVGVLLHGVS